MQSKPYTIYHDIMLDDRVGFEQDGIIYVDQAHAIKYEYDRKPSRSPSPCRSVMTPTTKTRSPKASKPCRVWAR
jgi:hypothetical protein